jgi:hypothetical protein
MEKDNFKLIVAVALGAIGGLLLARYVWGVANKEGVLSKHLDTLSSILKQIEGMNTDEAIDLKERIHTILQTIDSNYVSNKE